jgi:hypothetical protein
MPAFYLERLQLQEAMETGQRLALTSTPLRLQRAPMGCLLSRPLGRSDNGSIQS